MNLDVEEAGDRHHIAEDRGKSGVKPRESGLSDASGRIGPSGGRPNCRGGPANTRIPERAVHPARGECVAMGHCPNRVDQGCEESPSPHQEGASDVDDLRGDRGAVANGRVR
jgi:hypothetical protein